MSYIPNTTDEPVFIVGVTRSGTTLLEQILNRHPRLSIYHELHFLRRVWTHASTPTLDEAQLQVALDKLVNLSDEGLKTETIEQQFLLTDRSPRALYDTILRLHMANNGKLRIGEKTPSNFWFLDILFNWYPDARVIYTIRNPHSVYASFKNYIDSTAIPWRDRTVFGRALYWNYGARVLSESQAKYTRQLMCIAFEDLVNKPDKMLPAVCAFLGEDYHEDMLEITAVNSSFDKTTRQTGFRKETLQRHHHLGYLERLLIDLLCGPYMLANGYPLEVLSKRVIRVLDVLGFYSALNFIHGSIRRHRRQLPVDGSPKRSC